MGTAHGPALRHTWSNLIRASLLTDNTAHKRCLLPLHHFNFYPKPFAKNPLKMPQKSEIKNGAAHPLPRFESHVTFDFPTLDRFLTLPPVFFPLSQTISKTTSSQFECQTLCNTLGFRELFRSCFRRQNKSASHIWVTVGKIYLYFSGCFSVPCSPLWV